MLGRKTLTADVATVAGPSDFDTNQLAAGQLELGFTVEEDEMLVDLEARLVYDNSVAEATSFTFYIDGAASADLPVAGLYIETPAAGVTGTAYVRTTLRLDKGYHTVEARVTAATGVISYDGQTVMPSELVARRHSHPATLGHGVDSKVQLAQ